MLEILGTFFPGDRTVWGKIAGQKAWKNAKGVWQKNLHEMDKIWYSIGVVNIQNGALFWIQKGRTYGL